VAATPISADANAMKSKTSIGLLDGMRRKLIAVLKANASIAEAALAI
jgi:hypothetical protein